MKMNITRQCSNLLIFIFTILIIFESCKTNKEIFLTRKKISHQKESLKSCIDNKLGVDSKKIKINKIETIFDY